MIWCYGDSSPTLAVTVSMHLIDDFQQSPPTPEFTSFGLMLYSYYMLLLKEKGQRYYLYGSQSDMFSYLFMLSKHVDYLAEFKPQVSFLKPRLDWESVSSVYEFGLSP